MTPFFRAQPPGLLGKLLTAGLLVVTLAFSVVVFAVVVSVAAIAAGYLWWKTRAVRKQMRDMPRPDRAEGSGTVIEGEVIRETRDCRINEGGVSPP